MPAHLHAHRSPCTLTGHVTHTQVRVRPSGPLEEILPLFRNALTAREPDTQQGTRGDQSNGFWGNRWTEDRGRLPPLCPAHRSQAGDWNAGSVSEASSTPGTSQVSVRLAHPCCPHSLPRCGCHCSRSAVTERKLRKLSAFPALGPSSHNSTVTRQVPCEQRRRD